MTGSNDSLRIKYNFMRLQLSQYHIFRIESGKFAVTKPVMSYKPLHVAAI